MSAARIPIWVWVMPLIFLAGFSFTAPEAPVNSLVEAERSFSKCSVDKGIREAFLAYLADDAVVFRPGPTNGKKLYAARPESTSQLIWKPVYAELSRSGDFGFTTGPYEFRRQPSDKEPAGCGHYVSIWKKAASGAWKVAVDVGIDHPGPNPSPAEVFRGPESAGRFTKIDAAHEGGILMVLDRGLSGRAEKTGAAEAILDKADDDLRLYRPGAFPCIGKEASAEGLKKTALPKTWTPEEAQVSSAGDLGYTLGTGTFAPAPGSAEGGRFAYFRIWKKNKAGEWRILLDLINPMPAA